MYSTCQANASVLLGGANVSRSGSGAFWRKSSTYVSYASTALCSLQFSSPAQGRSWVQFNVSDLQLEAPPGVGFASSVLLLQRGLALGSVPLDSSSLDHEAAGCSDRDDLISSAPTLAPLKLDLGESWRVFFDTIEQWRVDRPRQRVFWNLFDEIQNVENATASYTALLRPVTINAAPGVVFEWLDARRLSDYFSEWFVQRDLSARDIRSILSTVASTLEQHDGAVNPPAVLERVKETLTKEINDRVKWRSRQRCRVTCDRVVASTHDRVLAFVFHTGISPPTWACTRLTVGWALVLTINALEVNYEKVRRRQACPDLRNALRGRCARARFHRGSRNRPSLGSCSQSTRRGRTWPDYPAAQRA